MAPNLSGIACADAARMAHLVELAVAFSCRHLKPDGALLVKLFHGSGYSDLAALFKQTFLRVVPLNPKAPRERSSGTFLLGRGLKKPSPTGLGSRPGTAAEPAPLVPIGANS